MQSSVWRGLLKLIPPEQRDTLMLVTNAGREITIQRLLRTEDDYLVIRGRLSGTTDAGHVLFIPFDQIHYLGFQHEVKEAQIHALYGESAPSAVAGQAKPEAGADPAAEAGPSSYAAPPASPSTAPGSPSAPQAPKAGSQHGLLNRKALLDQLRARNRAGSTSSDPRP